MAESIISENKYYKRGSISFQTVFVGKSNNGRTGYYGCIILNKLIPPNATITISDATDYGSWYSDNQSHVLNYNEISIISDATKENYLWFIIPATNINSDSIVWLRLVATISFSM